MSDTKLCPFCAEEIKKAAIKCKHCNEMLAERPGPGVVSLLSLSSTPANPSPAPESGQEEADISAKDIREESTRVSGVKRPPGLSLVHQNDQPRDVKVAPPGKSPAEFTPVGLLAVGTAVFCLVMWGVYLTQNPHLVAKPVPPPPKSEVELLYQKGDNAVFEVTTPDGKKARVHVNPEGTVRRDMP